MPSPTFANSSVEPVAVILARQSGRPVKIVMSREDVFRATGPTSGASMTVKIGVKRDGTVVAAEGLFKLQAGAFPGSPFMSTCICAFAPYDIPRTRLIDRAFSSGGSFQG